MGILFVVSPYSHRTLTNILAVYQGKIGDKSMARVEDLSVTYRRLTSEAPTGQGKECNAIILN